MNNQSEEATRDEVVTYVLGCHAHPEEWMKTPSRAFGGLTADEYGAKYGWDYVIATARRVFN